MMLVEKAGALQMLFELGDECGCILEFLLYMALSKYTDYGVKHPIQVAHRADQRDLAWIQRPSKDRRLS